MSTAQTPVWMIASAALNWIRARSTSGSSVRMSILAGLISSNGKVYRHVAIRPDEYLGRVNENGRMYQHDPLSPDDYIGRISNPPTHAHAGVAFLLLVWPEIEAE